MVEKTRYSQKGFSTNKKQGKVNRLREKALIKNLKRSGINLHQVRKYNIGIFIH